MVVIRREHVGEDLNAGQAHGFERRGAQEQGDGRTADREGVVAENEGLPFAASSLECVRRGELGRPNSSMRRVRRAAYARNFRERDFVPEIRPARPPEQRPA